MAGAVLSITLGFVLTTLIGGWYASYLLQRNWQHQNQSRLDEDERKQANEICTTLSELIDKRRYRMQRLLTAIDARAKDRLSDDELRQRRSDYEQVSADWNDQFTTRLATVGTYFGWDVREYLSLTIYKRFNEADQNLDTLYRQAIDDPGAISHDRTVKTNELIKALSGHAYDLSFAMMIRIRDGEIGRAAPHPLYTTDLRAEPAKEPPTPPTPDAQPPATRLPPP